MSIGDYRHQVKIRDKDGSPLTPCWAAVEIVHQQDGSHAKIRLRTSREIMPGMKIEFRANQYTISEVAETDHMERSCKCFCPATK